jgi:hypothetical protein
VMSKRLPGAENGNSNGQSGNSGSENDSQKEA